MRKVKRGLEVIFVFVAVLGLLTAVLLITGPHQTKAQSYPYPYPEPTDPTCGRIDDPRIGPYPAACLYLPGILSNPEEAPTPTILPAPAPLPISSPNIDTNTP
jgi:hypothetical protein